MKTSYLVSLGYPEEVAPVAAREIGQAMGRGELDAGEEIHLARSLLRDYGDLWHEFPDTVDALVAFHSKPQFEPRSEPAPYRIWGEEQIEQGALKQMELASQLPVAIRGALMPDAHQGYGLPIGGVLATDNCVIPYAVGVDIACRMKLSVFDLPVDYIDRPEKIEILKRTLVSQTRFGLGCAFARSGRRAHDVMDDSGWDLCEIPRDLKDLAWNQLGTSGGGNHFVEFGVYTSLKGKKKLALLSHSGSRGVGSKVALHYSRVAREMHPELPDDLEHLAWLDFSCEAAQEYWEAMQLMGRYAAANHDCIHKYIAKQLGATVIGSFENHHNFAWKENHYGRDVIVHRKGATPAQLGTTGVIPGSMSSPAYIVRGKGNSESLCSASHGAGRLLSRKKAKLQLDEEEVQRHLEEKGVTLVSAGLDEAPMAYKNIEDVMAAQTDLVEVIGSFDPKVVRMADD